MRRPALGLVLALGATLALTGCGLGSSDRPATTATVAGRGPAGGSGASRVVAHPRPPKHRTRRGEPGSERRPLHLPDHLPSRHLRLPILMYHRIADPALARTTLERSLTVAPADFAAQMRWLVDHGYASITQEQLYAAVVGTAKLPAKPVLITFDDGYRDVLVSALPVMQPLHLHGTAYVITSRVTGPDPTFLRLRHLRRLEAGGIEIGSHTVDHLELPTLSDTAATRQLVDSRRFLEQGLGHPVQWFCYPAGRFDRRSERLVRAAGYVLAVTTQPGADQQLGDPLALHRVRVADTTGVAGLASELGA